MDDKEIYDYYVEPFELLGIHLELSAAMLFPDDPPSDMKQYQNMDESTKYALIKGVNALFRFIHCDLIFYPAASPINDHNDQNELKKYSLIHCIEMILHQHNPLHIGDIDGSWNMHEAWITDEGEQFYAENENNLLEALTKRFKDYGVGFEKGHILKAPFTSLSSFPSVFPISLGIHYPSWKKKHFPE